MIFCRNSLPSSLFVWRLSAHRHNGGDVAARAPELARKLAQRVVRTLSQQTFVRPIPISLPPLPAPPVPQQQPPATPLDIDNSTNMHQSDSLTTTSQASAVLPEEVSSTASQLVEPGIVHSPLGYDRRSPPRAPVDKSGFDDSWGEQQVKRDAPRNTSQQTLDRAEKNRMSSGSSGSSGSGHGGKRHRTPPKGRQPPISANSSTKTSVT